MGEWVSIANLIRYHLQCRALRLHLGFRIKKDIFNVIFIVHNGFFLSTSRFSEPSFSSSTLTEESSMSAETWYTNQAADATLSFSGW